MVDTSNHFSEADRTLDEELRALINQVTTAVREGDKRRQRRVIHKFITMVQDSGKLGHPQRGRWPDGIYIELRNEALQRMWEYVTLNFDKYNPDFPVMAWINRILSTRFIDVVRIWMRHNTDRSVQVNPSVDSDDAQTQTYVISLDALERGDIPTTDLDEEIDRTSKIISIVAGDPIYSKDHIQGHPGITFAKIFIEKLNGKTFKEMASDYNLKSSNVSTFLYRKLKKYSPAICEQYENY